MIRFAGCILCAALALCASSPALAEDGSQFPAYTASGQVNLHDVWLRYGGGRLYWKTLVNPRQIYLAGARFVDPASVPPLDMGAPKSKPARHRARRARPAPPKAAAAPVMPPKDAASTALRPPEKPKDAAPAATPPKDDGKKAQPAPRPRRTVSGTGGGPRPAVTTYTRIH